MWSHYSKHHTGICLQFEPIRDMNRLLAVRVEYCDDYPHVDFFRIHGIRALMLRKHTGWRYEKEWRIVAPGHADTHIGFSSSALTGVIVGCDAPETTKRLLSDLLGERKRRGKSPLRVYSAVKHPSQYRLRLKRADVGA